MTSAIFRIGTFLQQELFYRGSAAEDELVVAGRLQDALLHHSQFNLEDLLQMFRAQGLEDDNLVDAVHELGGELATRSFLRRASHLVVELIVNERRLGTETHASANEVAHFG